MKKIFLYVIVLLIGISSVYAQCAGNSSYQTVQGNTISLTSPSFNSVNNWRVTTDTHGYSQNDIFSNPSGCTVDFFMPLTGSYTIMADNAAGAGSVSMTVTVQDVLATTGFGHQCYVIDTTDCADIYAYGDIVSTGSLDAAEIYSYGRIHSDESISVGNYVSPSVFMNTTFVSLPETYITSNLDVLGMIRGTSGVTIDDDTSITGSLVVSGSTVLYQISSISNNGNPITFVGNVTNIGDLLVTGTLTSGNSTVLGSMIVTGDISSNGDVSASGDVVASGNVRVTGADDSLQGAVNLIGACDARSARVYSTGSNVVMEIGNPSATCASGQPCTVNADCSSGNCNAATYTCT